MGAAGGNWETVIGLEVHVQLSTRSKMYCACPVVLTRELSEANRYVCPVCLGHPGTLPRPNRQAVVRALTFGNKAGCTVAQRSVLARKNYFYPDLPKGYQITQYELPICSGGDIHYWHEGRARAARLVRAHLEEDTAKLFHLPDGTAALDYNRAGVPLLEVVTQPDFRDGADCVSYLKELRSLLRRLTVSDAQMEAGQMRCEPNVSVRQTGSAELRTKTELKNLNSFTVLHKAIDAEARRQVEVYESGGEVRQATMRYDEARGFTVEMRRKESADDYRYFADPDIPPLLLSHALHEEAAGLLHDSAFAIRRKMVEDDGISHEQAATLVDDEILHRWYRLNCLEGGDPKAVANWVCGLLVSLLRDHALKIEPGELAEVVRRQAAGELTLPQAREVFSESFLSGRGIAAVVEAKGFRGQADEGELRGICAAAIAESPQAVADYRRGKVSAVQSLVGYVMRASRGAAGPDRAREMLIELLDEAEQV